MILRYFIALSSFCQRPRAWLVVACAGAALVPVGAGLASCSSAESTSASFAQSDGGATDGASPYLDGASPAQDSGPGFDASPVDGGAIGDAGFGDAAAPGPTSLIAVHAALGVADLRLCFKVGVRADGSDAKVLPIPALPDDPSKPMPYTNYPGIPLSQSAPIPIPSALATGYVTPYVVEADRVAAVYGSRPCDQLICSDPTCMGASDSWKLPVIQASLLVPHETNLLVVTGCRQNNPDIGLNAARCGAGYDPVAGNLHAVVVSLHTTETQTLAAQYIQLSPAIDPSWSTSVSFGRIDGGALTAIATNAPSGQLVPAGGVVPSLPFVTPATLADEEAYGVTVTLATTSSPDASTEAGTDGGDAEAGPPTYTFPLSLVRSTSNPLAAPGAFFQGPFVFALVGDPSVPQWQLTPDASPTQANLSALHIEAIPVLPSATSFDAGL
jgi:hypothetical protein